ncbi:MAG TPA: hypothetical protein VGP47_08205, partial [Parachlamydiaceae bacterium]|nr:hypothetical protein [Parachlamydiaceae bacterium]
QLLDCNEETQWRNMTANVAAKIAAHAMAALAVYPIHPSISTDPSPLLYSYLLTTGLHLSHVVISKVKECAQNAIAADATG